MSSTGQGRHLASIVGANIRRARDAQGLKQRELARKVGETVSVQQVSDWERGAYRPSDTNLLRVAEVLGRDFAWFFTPHADSAEPKAAA